jgi:hypothetical protein
LRVVRIAGKGEKVNMTNDVVLVGATRCLK